MREPFRQQDQSVRLLATQNVAKVISVCVCIYIYIYILYTEIEGERERERATDTYHR